MVKIFKIVKSYILAIVTLSPVNVRSRLALSLLFSLLAASGTGFSPVLLRFTTDSFGDMDLLFSWLAGYVLILCLSRLLTVIGGFLCRVALEEFSVSMGHKVLMNVFRTPRWCSSMNSAEWTHLLQISRSNNAAIISTCVNVIFPLIIKVFLSLISLVFFKDYFTTLLLVIYLILCSSLNISRVKKISRKYADAMNASSTVSGILGDIFSNSGLVRGFNASEVAISRYDQAGLKQNEKYKIALAANNGIDVSNAIIFMSILGISLSHAAWQVSHHTQSLGYFIMVNAIVYQVCQPLEGLLRAVASVSDCATTLRENAEKIDIRNLLRSTIQPTESEITPGQSLQKVSFSDVGFRYSSEHPWLFSGLNLALDTPGIMAITGPSGSGKSTFIKLLSGDLSPSEGEVLINDSRICSLSQAEIFRHLCIISQNPGLFNYTVRFNLQIASPHACDEELIKALSDCRLSQWFRDLPDGLDTILGAGGVVMSGGEKQRFSLARALLRDTPLIAIDEGTSALDYFNESEYLCTLTSLASRKLIIIVTHRLSSLTVADSILVLDKEGRVQFGSGNEVLGSNLYIRNSLKDAHTPPYLKGNN